MFRTWIVDSVIQLEYVNSLWMLPVFALWIVQGVKEIVKHIWNQHLIKGLCECKYIVDFYFNIDGNSTE